MDVKTKSFGYVILLRFFLWSLQGHNLKSLASKPASPRPRTALFFDLLKMGQGHDLFCLRLKFHEKFAIFCSNTFFLRTFPRCVLGIEHSCPWSREGLSSEIPSLASDFFVSLALSLVFSTPPLVITQFIRHVGWGKMQRRNLSVFESSCHLPTSDKFRFCFVVTRLKTKKTMRVVSGLIFYLKVSVTPLASQNFCSL